MSHKLQAAPGADPKPRAWTSEPMAWLVFALPASVVVAGIATAIIAWRGADGPIAGDTYRQGLAINESLARTALAHALGIEAEVLGGLGQAAGGEAVRILVRARSPLPDESEVELRWVHPGRSHGDRQVTLQRTYRSPDGLRAEYAGRVAAHEPAAASTAWQIVVATRSWRLDADVRSAGARTSPDRRSDTSGSAAPSIVVRLAP